jgi:hypothetical protein
VVLSYPIGITVGRKASRNLYILSNVTLPSVRLPSLRSVGTLTILECEAIIDVDMPALEIVEDQLSIYGSPNLLTLHSLPSLEMTSSVFENPQLPQCEVDAIAERIGISCVSLCSGNDEQATCDP